MTATLAAIIAEFWQPLATLLAGALGLLGLYLKGRSDARGKADARIIKASLEAERDRVELDDEINSDPDLATRARRIGLVRPDE